MTASMTVPFAGTRTAEAALSWGQESIWRTVRWLDEDDPYFNIPYVLPIVGGPDLDRVGAALRRLVERHEALRTTIADTPDGARQTVVAAGELCVDVHEAGDDDAQVAQRVAADLAARAFRYAEELPFRCAVVRRDGVATQLALALSHLAVDAWSIRVLTDDWAALVAGADPGDVPTQPLDRVAFERDGAGAGRGAESVEYWARTLAQAPRTLFDFPPREPETLRFVRVGMESPALAVAATELAHRWGVSTASVLTVACGVLLGVHTGHDRVALQLIVANRHDRRFRTMVGPAAQDGLLLLDLDAGSFAETVRRGHMQAMAAYRYGHYDPAAVRQLREQAGLVRGAPMDLSAYFNDIRASGVWPRLPAAPDGLRGLSSRTRTFVVGSHAKVDAKAFFATGAAPDTGQLYLLADTAYLARETAFALLRAVEEILVTAVEADDLRISDLAAVAGLAVVRRGPDWTRSGPDWVHLDAPAGASQDTPEIVQRSSTPGGAV
ncbi:condensation domain-containing protein [Micromonospora sediminimaris]|nr:condensation domain-containing protein [Micromonospora sediminimaris]